MSTACTSGALIQRLASIIDFGEAAVMPLSILHRGWRRLMGVFQ